MTRARLISLVRTVVCGLLLAAIFHVIFCNEVQLQAASEGRAWDDLSKWDQRRLAWTRGPAGLWETIQRLDAGSLAISAAACGSLIVFGGLRWRAALRVQGLDLPVREVLRISFVAHFFNAFLLGTAGGDVVKAWYAAGATADKKPEAALTVFADRLLGTLALLLFTASLLVPNLGLVLAYPRHIAVAALVLAMLAVAAALVVAGFYTDALGHDGRLARWVRRLPKGDSLSRGLSACRKFGRHRGFMAEVALWSALMNVCVVVAFTALASGLGIMVPAGTLWYVVPAVVSVAALPVTPSGLGVRENLFVWLLTVPALGVKPGAALSLSLLGYTVNLAWSAVGGIVYLLMPDRAKVAAARSRGV